MAQAIYREWFVDFRFPGHAKVKMVDSGTKFGKIPEGWKVSTIGDVVEVASRGPSLDYVEERGIPVINQRCVRDGRLEPVEIGRAHV